MKLAIIALCLACFAVGMVAHAALVLPDFLTCREDAQTWERAAKAVAQMCAPLQPEQ